MEILFLIYVIAGYWAAGKTIFSGVGWIGNGWTTLFIYKLLAAICLGFILIPIAIFKKS